MDIVHIVAGLGVVLLILGSAANILTIGKPREPITHGVALTGAIIQVAVAWAIVILMKGA